MPPNAVPLTRNGIFYDEAAMMANTGFGDRLRGRFHTVHPLRLPRFLPVYPPALRWSAGLANGQAGYRLSVCQKNGFHRQGGEPSVFQPAGPMTSPAHQRGAGFALPPFVPVDVRAHPPERWVKGFAHCGACFSDFGNRGELDRKSGV